MHDMGMLLAPSACHCTKRFPRSPDARHENQGAFSTLPCAEVYVDENTYVFSRGDRLVAVLTAGYANATRPELHAAGTRPDAYRLADLRAFAGQRLCDALRSGVRAACFGCVPGRGSQQQCRWHSWAGLRGIVPMCRLGSLLACLACELADRKSRFPQQQVSHVLTLCRLVWMCQQMAAPRCRPPPLTSRWCSSLPAGCAAATSSHPCKHGR